MKHANRKRKKKNQGMKLSLLLSIILLFFLCLALTIALFFLQLPQDIRQHAAGPTTYGTCSGSSPSQSGNCYATPNSCASQGLTQYYSSFVPQITQCGQQAYLAGVTAGTSVSCCPNQPNGYPNSYGSCGATNQGTCTSSACVGTPLYTDTVPTQCSYNGSQAALAVGTQMYCCSLPPTPTPTPTIDPCSTLQLNPNCAITANKSGNFCGGNAPPSNCQLGGNANTLYSCQCNAQGKNCVMVSSQNCAQSQNGACIVIPGGVNADHCGTVSPPPVAAAFSFNLTGIGPGGNKNPGRKTRTFFLYFSPHQFASALLAQNTNQRVLGTQVIKVSGTATYNASAGGFQASNISLAAVPAGQYDVILHVDGSLDKFLQPIGGAPYFTITNGQPITPSSVSLSGGDIAPPPSGDNFVDIQDYNALITCMNNVNCANKTLADINDDGIVDGTDLQLLLQSFGQLGDSFSSPLFGCVLDPNCKTGGGTIQFCQLVCKIQ